MLPDGSVVAGRFRIVGAIGAGRHGVVYRAEHEGHEVALKIVEEPNAQRAEALVATARRAQRIGGQGVIRVLGAGRDGDSLWLARGPAARPSPAPPPEENRPPATHAAGGRLVPRRPRPDPRH